MTIDPICGMTMGEASPLVAEHDGQIFYFCSNHCWQKFLSEPATAKHEEKPQGKPICMYPIHPEIQPDHRGDCPKCGMALVLPELTCQLKHNSSTSKMIRRYRKSKELLHGQ